MTETAEKFGGSRLRPVDGLLFFGRRPWPTDGTCGENRNFRPCFEPAFAPKPAVGNGPLPYSEMALAIRPLVVFPDPRLRLVAAPVTAFDADLRALADDLLDTLRAAPGIGITAPHVGVAARVVVLDLGSGDPDPGHPVRILVNPRILALSGTPVSHAEGSISMPGISEEVERPAHVRVAYQDLAGAAHEVEADGLLGVCLQHEIDQLDGLFWLQRLSRLKRDRAVKRFAKINGR